MNDNVLIKKLKQKDEKTFAKFFESYKNLVFYECYTILNDRMDAEDTLQEVFVEFFNRIDEIKENTNLKLYISSLAKRRAIDLYRKKANAPTFYSENMETFADQNINLNPVLTLDGVLEDIEAQVVTLKVIYNFSFQEIALDLRKTLGQIQGIYYYAIKKLKKHYKKGI